MSPNDLAKELSQMYHGAKKGEMSAMVHLFGVRYASQIKACDATAKQIALLAGLTDNYGSEINKAIKLAAYVVEK
jgi:5-methylcytosine-specific restriction protein B